MTKWTYIYDTYCGWCYGASGVIAALVESGAEVTMMHRHLFVGANAHRMGDGFGQAARQYDQRIQQLTGQPFGTAYFEKVLGTADEVLASAMTAQAAALVHDQGAKVEMELARILQKARYVDGISAGNVQVVQDALAQFGVTTPVADGADQAARMAKDAADLMARHGAQGVPLLLMETEGQVTQINISAFYKTPSKIVSLAA